MFGFVSRLFWFKDAAKPQVMVFWNILMTLAALIGALFVLYEEFIPPYANVVNLHNGAKLLLVAVLVWMASLWIVKTIEAFSFGQTNRPWAILLAVVFTLASVLAAIWSTQPANDVGLMWPPRFEYLLYALPFVGITFWRRNVAARSINAWLRAD